MGGCLLPQHSHLTFYLVEVFGKPLKCEEFGSLFVLQFMSSIEKLALIHRLWFVHLQLNIIAIL
jgi:hypothetical protein